MSTASTSTVAQPASNDEDIADGPSQLFRLLLDCKERQQGHRQEDCWAPPRQWLSKAAEETTGDGLQAIANCVGYRNEDNQKPLHLACQIGAPVDVVAAILNLITRMQEANEALDQMLNGALPIMFRHATKDRPSSPEIVQLLLSHTSNGEIQIDSDGRLPLSYLGSSTQVEVDEDSKQVQLECFDMYLKTVSLPSEKTQKKLIRSIYEYPDWLRNHAVMNEKAQICLNKAVADPFATAVVFCDCLNVAAVIATLQFIAMKMTGENNAMENTYWEPAVLFFSAIYYFLRNMFHALILFFVQGQLPDPETYMSFICQTVYIALVVGLASMLIINPETNSSLTVMATLTSAVAWFFVLLIMVNLSLEFRKFIGGILAMLPKIFAFMVALGVLLLAFAQMLLISTRGSVGDDSVCYSTTAESNADYASPFCTFSDSLLRVYTMSVGEVDEADFDHSTLSKVMYGLFLMIVVVLLANVLAYLIGSEIYHHDNHALRFWLNRMEYVLALDDIASTGPFALLRKCDSIQEWSEGTFQRLLSLFREKHLRVCVFRFWGHFFLRLCVVLFIGPLWLMIGLVSGGYLWPPQFREYLFHATPGTGKIDSNFLEEQNREMHALKSEVLALKSEIYNLEEKMDVLIQIFSSKMK